MLTGEIRNQINKLRDELWAGGVSNPLTGVEQITYLLFAKRLDDIQLREEAKATALKRPLAGGANYAAVKAATEAWTRALAHSFTKAARDEGRDLSGAAVIYRVKGLDGLEESLADAVVTDFAGDAADVNDQIIDLTGSQA